MIRPPAPPMHDVAAAAAAAAAEPLPAAATNLPRRYAWVLLTVVGLVLLDHAVIEPLLMRLTLHGPTINVAGRQRMLSQKLSKAALAMQIPSRAAASAAYHQELRQALAEWTRAHRGLVEGDQQLGLSAATLPEIQHGFARLQPSFEAVRAAAEELGKANANRSQREQLALVEQLLMHEARYLPQMEQLVQRYEQQARQQVLMLRLLGWSAAAGIVLSILGLGWFVLRPAHRTIRQQVNCLEEGIRQRTEQLSAANQALELEMAQRRIAEDQSRERFAQLAHAARITSLGQLATGIAHELNQPLAAITNYAEGCQLLLEDADPDLVQIQAHITHVSQAALRAGGILRRMRNFLRPSQACKEPVDLNALVSEVLDFFRHETARANVQVHLELAPQLPKVAADDIQIQQVLVNLIQNAIQALATSRKSPRKVTIQTSHAAGRVQVDVTDNGPGFGSADPDTLLSPFFTTKAQGLGMGLAISRAIVDEHGGQLWGSSQNSGGTTASGDTVSGATVSFALPTEGQSHPGLRREIATRPTGHLQPRPIPMCYLPSLPHSR